MTCNITIDGVAVQAEEGQSLLDAALAAGLYIPHLCKHPDLEAMGGCRLCSVEIDGSGRSVPACLTPVKDGMRVESASPAALKTRRTALELIMAAHPSECGDCPKYGRCELQSMFQYLGVSAANRKRRHRPVADDASNPLILHRFTRCIRCGRCVRACRELRGVKVLDFQHKNGMVMIGTDNGVSLAEAGCRFCGACIEVCPTGSILDQLHLMPSDMPYAKAVVPCRSECPAGVDVPRYLRYIRRGDYAGALAAIREKVPFPHTLGHVCTHACEGKCKRNELGGALSVCRLKGFAAEHDDGQWKERGFQRPESGKRVAVVGAGPAGLTAAYYLKKCGHDVTVYEANEKAGGQLRVGIPAYRLPDAALDLDIQPILDAGVRLECGRRIASLDELSAFDAVLAAVGTHSGVRLPLEGNELPGVVLNTDFLKSARSGSPLPVPASVAVLGGGSVAFDCARTALRLGAEDVHVVCLEDRAHMTAAADEIAEGEAEGVTVHDAFSFLRLTGDKAVTGVEIKKVSSFTFDENRRAVIETVEGSEEVVKADMVIFAVGQRPSIGEAFGLTPGRGNLIPVNGRLMSEKPGVFACGDAVTGTQSVVKAVAAGRQAASEMDRFLGGSGDIDECLTDGPQEKPVCIGRCEGFAGMTRMASPALPPEKSRHSFEEVALPLDAECAGAEASRCLQCDLRLEITRPRLWNDYEKGGR